MNVCAVDDSPWAAKGRRLQERATPAQYPENADIYRNNTCITGTGQMYHFSRCEPANVTNLSDDSSDNT